MQTDNFKNHTFLQTKLSQKWLYVLPTYLLDLFIKLMCFDSVGSATHNLTEMATEST